MTPDFSLFLFHVVDVGQHVGRRDKKPCLSQTEMHFSILKLAAAPSWVTLAVGSLSTALPLRTFCIQSDECS